MAGDTVRIIIEALIAAALCAAVPILIFMSRRIRPPRLPGGDGIGLCWLIAAGGSAPELERTVRLLADSPFPPCCVLIADCGMDDETRRVAAILERENASVLLAGSEELPKLLGDIVWTKQEAPSE